MKIGHTGLCCGQVEVRDEGQVGSRRVQQCLGGIVELLVETPERRRATFSTSGSSYFHVPLTTVRHLLNVHSLPCMICIIYYIYVDKVDAQGTGPGPAQSRARDTRTGLEP